jgi:hypothetical protein
VSQAFTNQSANAPFAGGPTPSDAHGQPPVVRPPQKSRGWVWLLGGCGCSVVLLLLCCGGLGYWGYTKGEAGLTTLVRQEVEDNDDVKEHLGEITSLKTDFIESASEKQTRGGSSSWLVFHAVGTKGSGDFITEMSGTPKNGGTFTSIELRLKDGKKIQIK